MACGQAVVSIHPPVLGSGSGRGGRDRLREGTRRLASRDGFTACLGFPARIPQGEGVNRYQAVRSAIPPPKSNEAPPQTDET